MLPVIPQSPPTASRRGLARVRPRKPASGGLGGTSFLSRRSKPRPACVSGGFGRRSAKGTSKDPYGRMTKISGDRDSLFGFTGMPWHQASGLNLAVFRAYDPNLGRWISRDPLDNPSVFSRVAGVRISKMSLPIVELMEGLNLFNYASNSPIRMVDRLGLACELIELSTERTNYSERTVWRFLMGAPFPDWLLGLDCDIFQWTRLATYHAVTKAVYLCDECGVKGLKFKFWHADYKDKPIASGIKVVCNHTGQTVPPP